MDGGSAIAKEMELQWVKSKFWNFESVNFKHPQVLRV